MKQGAPAPSISFFEPMKALTVRALPVGRWLYEVKFDGYRALAFKFGKETRLIFRNQKQFTKFPQLNDALKSLPAENSVIDGEIAALDQEGRPSFQLLQAYEVGEERPPLVYNLRTKEEWEEIWPRIRVSLPLLLVVHVSALHPSHSRKFPRPCR
jgi:bifunctional non-homologous end joining protein LigD